MNAPQQSQPIPVVCESVLKALTIDELLWIGAAEKAGKIKVVRDMAEAV